MISDAKVIVNRCGREGCGIVYVLVARRQMPFMISEFAGNTPCENITGHDMSEWTRATIQRDVLILQALWTVGRSVTPGELSDPTAHILADSLGYRNGDCAPMSTLPAWMCDRADLSWPAVILARRIAIALRDEWMTDQVQHRRWQRIVSYLTLWNDRVH